MVSESDARSKVLKILHEEIVPAQGCTEPIAIALVAAKVREVLGVLPEQVSIFVSGNIIKNVKSVVVPGSGGMIGIEAAAAMGIVAGDCSKDLMVISGITEEDMAGVRECLERTSFKVIHEKTPIKLYIRVEAVAGDQSAEVEARYLHTNLTRVVKNGQVLLNRGFSPETFHTTEEDRSILSVRLIYDLARTIDLGLIRPLFRQVIDLNSTIAEEGLHNTYGVNIGAGRLSPSTGAGSHRERPAARRGPGTESEALDHRSPGRGRVPSSQDSWLRGRTGSVRCYDTENVSTGEICNE